MKLAAAFRLGRCETDALIGAGGMGEVYRARDTRLCREVASKVLPAESSADRERFRRFEPEACAVAAIDHPNILVIHDIGTHAGAPYLVTELLAGETLQACLNGGPLPLGKAVEASVHWLANAIDLGFLNHYFLSTLVPFLAGLRGHPRFGTLMERAREMQRAFEV